METGVGAGVAETGVGVGVAETGIGVGVVVGAGVDSGVNVGVGVGVCVGLEDSPDAGVGLSVELRGGVGVYGGVGVRSFLQARTAVSVSPSSAAVRSLDIFPPQLSDNLPRCDLTPK